MTVGMCICSLSNKVIFLISRQYTNKNEGYELIFNLLIDPLAQVDIAWWCVELIMPLSSYVEKEIHLLHVIQKLPMSQGMVYRAMQLVLKTLDKESMERTGIKLADFMKQNCPEQLVSFLPELLTVSPLRQESLSKIVVAFSVAAITTGRLNIAEAVIQECHWLGLGELLGESR